MEKKLMMVVASFVWCIAMAANGFLDLQPTNEAQCKLQGGLFAKVASQFGKQAPARRLLSASQSAGSATNTIECIIKAKVSDEFVQRLKDSGATINSVLPKRDYVRAVLPVHAIESIAAWEEVISICEFIPPVFFKANTSEGDVSHAANSARSKYGVSGKGIKVGVISDTVQYLAEAQRNGDLPNVSIIAGSTTEPTGEGTGMLEIVHDLAPDAELYFATADGGEEEMADNIDKLAAAGCRVIVDDVGYPAEPIFEDGTIVKSINSFVDGGGVYFSAAGNDGNSENKNSLVWEGDFKDGGEAKESSKYRYHAFLDNITYNPVYLFEDSWIRLTWSDKFGESSNDYRFLIYKCSVSGNNFDVSDTVVYDSGPANTEGKKGLPYHALIPKLPEGLYAVSILKAKNAAARKLSLFINTEKGGVAINTGDVTYGHCASEKAIGVAAVTVEGRKFNKTDVATYYSSSGPRQIFYDSNDKAITPGNFLSSGGKTLLKPDIAAAAGVSCAWLDLRFKKTGVRFPGTSAAAPHAAAIAALMLEADPELTRDEILSIMKKSAISANGQWSETLGWGIVDAENAVRLSVESASKRGRPNLSFYTPTGWKDPLVVAANTERGDSADVWVTKGGPIYFSYAYKNSGSLATNRPFTNIVEILNSAGNLVASAKEVHTSLLSVNAGVTIASRQVQSMFNVSADMFDKGDYVFRVRLDTLDGVSEVNEDDNVYELPFRIYAKVAGVTGATIYGTNVVYGGQRQLYECKPTFADGWVDNYGEDASWEIVSGAQYAVIDAPTNGWYTLPRGRLTTLPTKEEAEVKIQATCLLYNCGIKTAPFTIKVKPTVDLNTALDNDELEFRTGGDSEWFGQYDITSDGKCAARSGWLYSAETNWVETTVVGPGVLRFSWLASTESFEDSDYLSFNYDGWEQIRTWGYTNQWQRRGYQIPAGEHVLRWQYQKDVAFSFGEDAGFLDNIEWIPEHALATPAVSASKNDSEKVIVEWNAVSGASQYYVYRKRQGERFPVKLGTTSETSYLDNDAAIGQDSEYLVCAVSATASSACGSAEGRRIAYVEPKEDFAPVCDSGGGDFGVMMRANAGWRASASEDWLSLVETYSLGSGCVAFSVAENTSSEDRTGTIVVSCGIGEMSYEIEVVQTGAKTYDLGFYKRAGWDAALFLSPTNGGDYVASSAIKTNETSYIRFTVGNYGTVTSDYQKVRFELEDSSGGLIAGATGNESSVKTLPPGWIYSANGWKWPAINKLTPGDYTLRVTIDPDNLDKDSNPENNVATYLFSVIRAVVEATETTPVPVSYEWLNKYDQLLAMVGGDYEAAATMQSPGSTMSGKKWSDGRPVFVWEDYLVGTNPLRDDDVFHATIEMTNGRPVIIWTPNINEVNANSRVYTIWGKTNLIDKAWYSPTNDASRFFKVTVEMP